jgi:dTDP-4-dehydrorhamnose reductase
MPVAIIGARGQLGTALCARLGADAVPLGHDEIEITEVASVESALAKAGCDCVINAAAYNLVDRAEEDPATAYEVNALGPRNLARYCSEKNVTLVHVSTDYVFGVDPARKRPYRETDVPGPLGAYAVSKLAGEYFVRAGCPRHFIVRTCGLFGRSSSAGKANFVNTMLRLAGETGSEPGTRSIPVVDDQRCTPSFAGDVAAAIVDLVRTGQYGLYHATNAGSVTWCGFAREIFRNTAANVRVRAVPSSEFPQRARRPGYSVLDGRKLATTIGRSMPPWQDGLRRYLAERGHGSRADEA